MKPTIGWYTLDLTSAEKGKAMEPVRVSMSADGKKCGPFNQGNGNA